MSWKRTSVSSSVFGRDFGSYSNRVVDISVFAFSLVFLRIGVVFSRVLNAIEIAVDVCDFGSVFRFGIVFSGVLIHREGRWQIFPHVFQYLEMMYSEPNFGSVLIHREGRW